jgi:hypothetical protein
VRSEVVDEVERLRAENARLVHEREQLVQKIGALSRELEQLRRQLYGRKSEKVNDAQLQLSLLPVLEALGRLQAGDITAAAEAEQAMADLRDQLEPESRDEESTTRPSTPQPPKKQPRRRKPDAHDLPVLDVVLDVVLEPPERTAPGGEQFEKIGEDVAEHFERKPGSMIRVRVIRPMLARLFAWARAEHRSRNAGGPLKTAVGYLLRQRRPLTRFLDDGELRLDTNPAELALRRQVVGRKNWLFIGSDGAAHWNTNRADRPRRRRPRAGPRRR